MQICQALLFLRLKEEVQVIRVKLEIVMNRNIHVITERYFSQMSTADAYFRYFGSSRKRSEGFILSEKFDKPGFANQIKNKFHYAVPTIYFWKGDKL